MQKRGKKNHKKENSTRKLRRRKLKGVDMKKKGETLN